MIYRYIKSKISIHWISNRYRPFLGPGGEGAGGRSGGESPPPPSLRSRVGAPFGRFLCRSSRYNKVQFYCRSAGRERALFLPISDNNILRTKGEKRDFIDGCEYSSLSSTSVSFWPYTTKFIVAPSLGNLPYLLNGSSIVTISKLVQWLWDKCAFWRLFQIFLDNIQAVRWHYIRVWGKTPYFARISQILYESKERYYIFLSVQIILL